MASVLGCKDTPDCRKCRKTLLACASVDDLRLRHFFDSVNTDYESQRLLLYISYLAISLGMNITPSSPIPS